MVTTIAKTADDITLDWLGPILAESEAFEGAEIDSIAVEPFGNGVLARMSRVAFSYAKETTAPTSIVVKYPSDDPGSFGLAQAMGLYELETRFYQDVAPLLPEAPIARCFGAVFDPETSNFTILLEDLGAVTRPGNVFEESTLAECQNVLGALAKIQAPLWNSDKLASLEWLSDPGRAIATFDALPAGLEPFLARLGHHLEPRQVEILERILPLAPKYVRSWTQPLVVQHGDFRSDNMLHGTSPTAPPVTVIDFQTLRLGPPGVDAAYNLGSALSTPTRRNLEKDLIAGYHKELVAGGVEDFDFDSCWQEYCAGSLYGVYLFVGMGAQVEASEHADRVMSDQIKRYADMAIDLDALGAAGLS